MKFRSFLSYPVGQFVAVGWLIVALCLWTASPGFAAPAPMQRRPDGRGRDREARDECRGRKRSRKHDRNRGQDRQSDEASIQDRRQRAARAASYR